MCRAGLSASAELLVYRATGSVTLASSVTPEHFFTKPPSFSQRPSVLSIQTADCRYHGDISNQNQ